MISDQAVQAIMNDLDASTIEWMLFCVRFEKLIEWELNQMKGKVMKESLKKLKKPSLFCYFWVSLYYLIILFIFWNEKY